MSETTLDKTRAIQRRGRWSLLQTAIADFRKYGGDPDQYATARADLAELEAEMRAAGQEP